MENNLHKAFTLVELIVVITILAILATVAFISFQGYSTESRDTKRISDIATISKGLQVYLAANSVVPEPSETKTTITFSGSELVTQGYAGESVLNILRVKEAQDPIDQTFYTYATNPNNTKFQLVGFLENTQTASNFLENKLFADYSQRNIHSAGESVGIFLDDTNTPIQELGNTTVEIEGNNTVYKAVLNKQNIVTQSGIILKAKVLGAQQNLYGWRAFDPNCTIDDIQIGDQTWAGCNSTLGNGLEWGERDSNNQESSVLCYDYNGTSIDCGEYSNDLMLSNSDANNYFEKVNILGNSENKEYNTIWGKLYTGYEINSACVESRQVPTDEQWEELETYMNQGTNCRNSSNGWGCNGLGWEKNDTFQYPSIADKLQVPLSGYRNAEDEGGFTRRGRTALFWSKTLENDLLLSRLFLWNYDSILRQGFLPDRSFSVRCIKN